MQLLASSLARSRARSDSSRLRSGEPRGANIPWFATAGFEPLDSPFREPIAVLSHAPGELSLRTRLTVEGARTQPVHWEIALRPQLHEPERYGLLLAQPDQHHRVSVQLTGLEPGRRCWARLWAGGHWSSPVLLHSASHHTAVAEARKLSPAKRLSCAPTLQLHPF